jgi:hypothetical protein
MSGDRNPRHVQLYLAPLLVIVIGEPVFGSEPPDLELNPVTRFVESVDTVANADERVRHVDDAGQGGSRTVSLISAGTGANPRIAITPSGTSWVVWWHDAAIDEIRFSHRDPTTKLWSAEAVMSSAGEDSRNPEIVHHDGETWVAYEVANGGMTLVTVTGIIDDPDPIPDHTPIATTAYTDGVDVLVHSESGHLWVTWVDSTIHVGWSERNATTGLWSLPQQEPYVSDGITAARDRIRATVLGQ